MIMVGTRVAVTGTLAVMAGTRVAMTGTLAVMGGTRVVMGGAHVAMGGTRMPLQRALALSGKILDASSWPRAQFCNVHEAPGRTSGLMCILRCYRKLALKWGGTCEFEMTLTAV